MKRLIISLTPLFLILCILLASSSMYVVNEGEQVIITEFGKPVGTPINADPQKNEAGLHFKKPFIQSVNRLEKRVLEWDGPATEMPTRDKLYISVDNFARWRIADPVKFFVSLRDERTAQSRLDDAIGGATRSVIANHDLIEVVRSNKERKAATPVDLQNAGDNLGRLPSIRFGRHALDREILAAAKPKAVDWGIELIDVRFKRINYKAGVIQKIYDRMQSERRQIANRFLSEGDGEAARINGKTQKELLAIQSQAYQKEQEIKGKADADAMQIYSQAYNSSPLAAEFYRFMKTLETYEQTFAEDTTMILTTDTELFRMLKNINPETESSATPSVAPTTTPE